jgi:transposase
VSLGRQGGLSVFRDERVRKLHVEGLPHFVIAARVGCSTKSVKNILRRLGLDGFSAKCAEAG